MQSPRQPSLLVRRHRYRWGQEQGLLKKVKNIKKILKPAELITDSRSARHAAFASLRSVSFHFLISIFTTALVQPRTQR